MTKFTKRKKIETIAKILNVNKPIGISSYDVVRKVKKVLHFKKVGHAGTLDPFADGVLIILIGRGATKKMNEILAKTKTYKAVLKLGEKTNTGDNEGVVINTCEIPEFTPEKIDEVKNKFIGEYLQTPPQYSAKKVNGKPAYKYARKGIEVELKPKKVTINALEINNISNDELIFTVNCSSGTYIRVLGEELAEQLGTVGHLVKLTRESIGEYNLGNAADFDNLETALEAEIRFLQSQSEMSVN